MAFGKAKDGKLKYALIAGGFIAAIALWALSPLMNKKTHLNPAISARFMGRAVNLNSIKVGDLRGEAPGTPINSVNKGKKGKKENEVQSSFLKPVKDDELSATAKTSTDAAAAGNSRYTPSKEGAVAAKQNKGYAGGGGSSVTVAGKLNKAGGGLNIASAGASKASAPLRRNLFGAQVSDAKLSKGDLGDVKFDKKDGDALRSLKVAALKSFEAKKAGADEEAADKGTAAFEGNRAAKDLATPLEEYKKSGTSKFLEMENKDMSGVTGNTAKDEKKLQFPAPPSPSEKKKSDEDKDEEVKDMEDQLENDPDAKSDQLKYTLIQMALTAVLGPVFGAMGQMIAKAINPSYQAQQQMTGRQDYYGQQSGGLRQTGAGTGVGVSP